MKSQKADPSLQPWRCVRFDLRVPPPSWAAASLWAPQLFHSADSGVYTAGFFFPRNRRCEKSCRVKCSNEPVVASNRPMEAKLRKCRGQVHWQCTRKRVLSRHGFGLWVVDGCRSIHLDPSYLRNPPAFAGHIHSRLSLHH